MKPRSGRLFGRIINKGFSMLQETKIHQRILKEGRQEADRILSFARSGRGIMGAPVSSQWLLITQSVGLHPASDNSMNHLLFLFHGASELLEGDGGSFPLPSSMSTSAEKGRSRLHGKRWCWCLATSPQDGSFRGSQAPGQLPPCVLCPPLCPHCSAHTVRSHCGGKTPQPG